MLCIVKESYCRTDDCFSLVLLFLLIVRPCCLSEDRESRQEISSGMVLY